MLTQLHEMRNRFSFIVALSMSGCFSKDQVYLDGILRILRHRRNIDFKMLTSLGKVSLNSGEQSGQFTVPCRPLLGSTY